MDSHKMIVGAKDSKSFRIVTKLIKLNKLKFFIWVRGIIIFKHISSQQCKIIEI